MRLAEATRAVAEVATSAEAAAPWAAAWAEVTSVEALAAASAEAELVAAPVEELRRAAAAVTSGSGADHRADPESAETAG